MGSEAHNAACHLGLLTVNCGPVVKGSGNGFIIGSAGNVFILKNKIK